MKKLIQKLKYKFLVWKHEKFYPWFAVHKNDALFKTLEKANWFPWYGRKLVYVKSKDVSELTVTERDVKEAIQAKDYKKALEIIIELPETAKTVALKQVIQAKIDA
ncbi:MAG: hypothetical protein GY861_29260 [bacterium]|nr:hypothetical protein [bacterium]